MCCKFVGARRRRRYRKRTRRVPTPVTDPCELGWTVGGEVMDKTTGSRLEGTSEDRIARYKEERRRQLREQFKEGSSSSGTENGAAPRTTRAYRLRVAAAATAAAESASQCSPSPAKEVR